MAGTPVETGLLIASLAAALAYVPFLRRPPSLVRSILKTIPIAALAVLAAFIGAPLLLVLALGFSALGDLALSRDGERAFMAGLGAFLLAHIFYVPLLFGVGEGFAGWRWAALAGACAYAAMVARWLWPHLGPMRAPVAVYMIAIVAMGAAALTAPPALWPVMLGAALFIVSDTVLAAETFVFAAAPRRWTAPVVWSTYYAGQALIASAWLCPQFAAG